MPSTSLRSRLTLAAFLSASSLVLACGGGSGPNDGGGGAQDPGSGGAGVDGTGGATPTGSGGAAMGLSCKGNATVSDCSGDICDTYPGCSASTPSSCSGEGSECFEHDDQIDACDARWGCKVASYGECVDDFVGCDEFEDNLGACVVASGCVFTDGWCFRDDVDCTTRTTESACAGGGACDWIVETDLLCQGAAKPCEEIPVDYCADEPACELTPATCTGTPTPCEQLDPTECNAQPGCHVERANGTVVPASVPNQGISTQLADLDLWVLEVYREPHNDTIDLWFNFREFNRGVVAAPIHTSLVLVSPDDTFGNSDDLTLYEANFPEPIEPNGEARWGTDGYFDMTTLVETIPPGWYYVAAVLDTLDQVTEYDEDNNFHQLPGQIYIGPAKFDLVAVSAEHDATATLAPEDTLSITVEIENKSTEPMTSVPVRVVLSEDGVIDGSDVEICSETVAFELDILSTDFLTLDCDIPRVRGDYTVLVQLDAEGALLDETPADNIVATATDITVYAPSPDLTITSVVTDMASVAWKGAPTFTAAIENTGPDASGAYQVAYYLSKDAVLTGIDPQVCTWPMPSLAGSSSASAVRSCTLPGSIRPGNYTIFAVVDFLDAVFETDEDNNTQASATNAQNVQTTGFNMTTTLVGTNEATVSPGQLVTIRWIGNVPSLEVPASTVTFYLSPDTVIDEFDEVLCEHSVPAAPNGSSPELNGTCNLPADTSPGIYYVGAIFDAEDLLPENDETDNAGYDDEDQITVP